MNYNPVRSFDRIRLLRGDNTTAVYTVGAIYNDYFLLREMYFSLSFDEEGRTWEKVVEEPNAMIQLVSDFVRSTK